MLFLQVAPPMIVPLGSPAVNQVNRLCRGGVATDPLRPCPYRKRACRRLDPVGAETAVRAGAGAIASSRVSFMPSNSRRPCFAPSVGKANDEVPATLGKTTIAAVFLPPFVKGFPAETFKIGSIRAIQKGVPNQAPLSKPPQRGTEEQHRPALPFEEVRSLVLSLLFKNPWGFRFAVFRETAVTINLPYPAPVAKCLPPARQVLGHRCRCLPVPVSLRHENP